LGCRRRSLTGSDGRQPFTPEEEAAILTVLRIKRVWPAFAGSGLSIGCKGFRSCGYHEKARTPVAKSVTKKRKRPAEPVAADVQQAREPSPIPDYRMLDDILDMFATKSPTTKPLSLPPMGAEAAAEHDLAFNVGLHSLLVANNLEPVTPVPDAPFLRERARQIATHLDGPNAAVLVINANATGFGDLVAAQNARSVGLVGALVESEGGRYRPIVSHAQLLSLLRYASYCAANPRVAVTLPIDIALASGVTATFRVEAQAAGDGLFAFCARA